MKEKKGKRDPSGAIEEEKEKDSSSDGGEQQEESEDEVEEDKPEHHAEENEDEDEDEDGEEEEDIPLSDLSEDEREDVIPHQRLTINNSAAINTSLKRISFITAATPFSEHNSLVSTHPIDVPDPNDDLNRELAFYKVCQDAATTARGLLKKEGIPFTRPGDYFAEMVKSDEHMGRIKKKLFDEAAAKKASAEARKQRDLKKFGKQVQVAKMQQRSKEKREMLEKIDVLKKSEFSFSFSLLSSLPQNLQVTDKQIQNVKTTPTPRTTQKAFSTLKSTTPPSQIPVSAAAQPWSPRGRISSARKRTRSLASVERSVIVRAAMPSPLLICAVSP